MNKCPKCNTEFNCGKVDDNPCWCNNVHLTKAQLKALLTAYTGCLCPNCLENISKMDAEKIKTLH